MIFISYPAEDEGLKCTIESIKKAQLYEQPCFT